MSPQSNGGRPARRSSTGSRRARPAPARSRGNDGTAGTRHQQIRRDHGDDEAFDSGRYRARRERNFELPRAVVDELRNALDPRQAAIMERRMVNAAQAYERDRYKEALSAVKPVVDAVPESAAARELYGLILYRLGRWRQAAKELRAVHEQTGSFDQHPVIADCERALGHLDRVEALWAELRTAGVDREVLIEGRLVMAGALADVDRVGDAIELLRPDARGRKHPDLALLREWYALASFYEQAGDLPAARDLYGRVATQGAGLTDAADRLRSLR